MKIFPQRSTNLLLTVRLLIASTLGLSLVVSTFSTALAAPQTKSKPWVSTKLLDKALDQVSTQPIVADWASQTKQILASIAAADQSAQQRIAQISLLDQQVRSIDPLCQHIMQSSLAKNDRQLIFSQLQQLRYQFSRRTATWSVIAKLGDDNVGRSTRQESFHIELDGIDSQWANYLSLGQLQAAFAPLADDQKAKRIAARQTLARIYSASLTTDQANYLRTLFPDSDIQLLKSYASRKVDPSSIANRLELYEAQPSSRSGYLLNDVLQDLLWSNELAYQRAAEVIQLYYRNGNFRLTISEAFMNRLLPQLPTITEPVSETIQDADVYGQSRVSNRLKVDLLPDDNQIKIQIQTNGHVQSNTVAKTRAFRIMNQGQANFHVVKEISVSANGIDASQKAYSTSSAKQLLVGIQSKMDNVPLIGKIARRAAARKVREQSPETNQLFRRKVSLAAEARVEEEIAKQIESVRKAASEKLFEPLVRMGLEPTPLQLATTESAIEIRYRLAGPGQMAANTARPTSSGQSMVTTQLHQSLVNNAIARLGLNGESFSGQELAAHLQDVLGVNIKADSEDDQKDAQFKFAAFDPIRIDFKDSRINIVINLDSLQVGDKAKPIRRLSITASYAIEANGMQVRLIQDDTGTRVTSRGKRLRLGDRAVISTVMKMLFEPSYSVNALPKEFRDRPQAQSLRISRLVIDDGWLAVEMDDVLVAQTERTPVDNGRPESRLGENLRRMFKQR